MPKALTQGLGFLNRLEDRLEEQSFTACGRRLCGIRWDWHFCWWPAKSILCEGWRNHQTPSGKAKTSNVTTQDCLQSGTFPEPGSYTRIEGSKMKVCLGPSSASTAIWWCHTVRTQVGLLEPLPSLTSPKRYPAYGRRGSPDHSSKFPTSAPRLRRKSPPFLSRLPGSTRRKCLTAPTLPSLAA